MEFISQKRVMKRFKNKALHRNEGRRASAIQRDCDPVQVNII
jgi:hypothetical protein